MNDLGAMMRVIKWIKNPGTLPYINDLNDHGQAARDLLGMIKNCSGSEAWQLIDLKRKVGRVQAPAYPPSKTSRI